MRSAAYSEASRFKIDFWLFFLVLLPSFSFSLPDAAAGFSLTLQTRPAVGEQHMPVRKNNVS